MSFSNFQFALTTLVGLLLSTVVSAATPPSAQSLSIQLLNDDQGRLVIKVAGIQALEMKVIREHFDRIDWRDLFPVRTGQYETNSPVRTFMPLVIGGQPHLMAAYTCTPLVIIPIKQINTESHIKGRTIAELGNRNRPLDMIVYQKDGESFVLMANSSRGVMKIATKGIETIDTITSRVGGGGTAGLSYDTIDSLKGVVQLDKLDDHRAVVLIKDKSGKLNLQMIDLP